MGLLQNLTSQVNDITGDAGSGNKFPKTLKTADFFTSNVSLPADEFVKLGEFVVPAQEAYRWGKGAAKFEANQGYIYILVKNTATTPAEIPGTVRLQQRDAQERNIITVFEEEGEVLHGSKSDRTNKQALPEQQAYPKVGHNSKLVIAFRAESTDTANATATDLLIPVTVYPQ